MLDVFLFAALPYLAVFTLVGGCLWRLRSDAFSYSSLSSQFLEGRGLKWGSVPWHAGLFVILAGHLLALALPGVWQRLMAIRPVLLAVEITGALCAFLCLWGLAVLVVRRLVTPSLQVVTTPMDFVVLGLLVFQIGSGLWLAMVHRWGAAWAPAALSPYLRSLLLAQPRVDFMADLPGLVKLHVAGFWVLLAVFPFTRLVHAVSVPLHYLWRPPQQVLWANPRRVEAQGAALAEAGDARRHFLKAAMGVGAASALLSVGALDKLVRYFKGPEMTTEEQAELLSKKLERLNLTAEQRNLELERLRSPTILVARVSELSRTKGKYFTDYQMRPALAFAGEDGFPVVISAKCTHLGCTVGSDLDGQGRILCPCHVSYFDIRTGAPNEGAPAKAPLPILGWVLRDAEGAIVAEQDPAGRRTGTTDPELIRHCTLHIARKFETESHA